MADALVYEVLEQLRTIIVSEVWEQVQKEVGLVVDVKNEVRKLERNFQAIQDVLADAEQRQLKERSIKRWMGQLKDVCYDIDDVLDEWSTAIAKSQMKVNDEHPPKTIRKVCSMIFSRFCFREVGLRFDVAHEIQTLNDRIDGIEREKNRFHFKLSEGETKLPEHKITASVIDATEIKGRETDKDTIVKMLLSESSDQELAPRTISLVGMGGIGKTTLAQLVYNDHQVETYFEERIWVCVSDPFDEIRIAKAILEGLNESAHNLIELQALLLRIQESIREKRFLLVLDDVWNEDSTKWEQLKNSLKRGCLSGSRFLVTTRNTKVASIMGSSSTDILKLGLLSTDECWSLFSQFAFFEKNSGERENLEETGRKIAERCKGLPLAAKTLGSLLRFKRSRAEWESVLNNHVWEIEEAESKLLAPLWLSYHDLPTVMRPCFLYCAVFPKDYTFERDTLIKLWMAQGFLRETQNQEMELTGGECFETLAARSLFQDFKKNEDGSIIECKMHDIVHDFAQFMTKNEIFSVEIDGGLTVSKIESFSGDARHSMVVFRKFREASFPATIHSFKKLRSLIVYHGYHSSMNAVLPNLIANLSCIRTLKLVECGIDEVPSNIGKLIHLRHFDLSGNSIKELPEEICELYNMQTLDVSCCGLEKLPENIGKLIKLRHLHVSNEDESFIKMRGFEGLGCLRELDEFHVSDSGEGSNIGGLKNLNHLQGSLMLKWLGDVKDPDEAKKAELKSKKNLTQLELFFMSRTERSRMRDDEILEALELPPNIDWLGIYDCKGTIQVPPSWINNNKLRVVRLGWGKIENLPSLGKLPFLEELHVSFMESVRKVGREFLGMEAADDDGSDIGIGEMTASPSTTVIAFPSLKTLQFSYLREWEEWEGEGRRNEDKTIMPSLRSLDILWCPKLKALPDYIYQSTTLEKLVIIGNPILKEQFKEGGQGWPNTSHTPNITFEYKKLPNSHDLIQNNNK